MSADNWLRCFNCQRKADEEHQRAEATVRSKYGSIPADEFVRELQAVKVRPVLDATMREDYEVGLDESDSFSVDYRCSCETCGFSWSYKHTRAICANEIQWLNKKRARG
jgi:hypothetical protein